jgi:hypothetical protein
MPRVYDSLALAASSYNHSRENRLTEIFGTVLQAHAGLANLVLANLGLRAVSRVDVWRQEKLEEHGQVDLILRGTGSGGRSAVYFEHKEPGGGWQEGQPGKYLKSLRGEIAGGAQGKLLVIVGAAPDAHGRVRRRVRSASSTSAIKGAAELRIEADDELMRYATWHEVAGWAFDAGKESSDTSADWVAAARRPASRADQRLLAELVWYLEEEGYGMTKALGKQQIEHARAALQFLESIDVLVEDVSERLVASEPHLGLRRVQGKSGDFHPPARSWVARYDGRFYVGFDTPTDAADPGKDTPPQSQSELRFYVGAWVGSAGAKRLERKADWEATVAAANLDLDDGDVVASYDAMGLEGISTLSQQGEMLADWAIDAVRAILALKPGPLVRSRGPRGRRK